MANWAVEKGGFRCQGGRASAHQGDICFGLAKPALDGLNSSWACNFMAAPSRTSTLQPERRTLRPIGAELFMGT